jgi:hypothetical protein
MPNLNLEDFGSIPSTRRRTSTSAERGQLRPKGRASAGRGHNGRVFWQVCLEREGVGAGYGRYAGARGGKDEREEGRVMEEAEGDVEMEREMGLWLSWIAKFFGAAGG